MVMSVLMVDIVYNKINTKMNQEFPEVKQFHPEKAANRVSITAFMMSSLFLILTLIWTLSPEKFDPFMIAQLVLAIPLLFISSLAYSKLGYWKNHDLWDKFGWFTGTLGNIFVINVVGLMTATFSKTISLLYFILTFLLILSYYSISMKYKPYLRKEKIIKFVVFIIILLLGGILPVVFNLFLY